MIRVDVSGGAQVRCGGDQITEAQVSHSELRTGCSIAGKLLNGPKVEREGLGAALLVQQDTAEIDYGN